MKSIGNLKVAQILTWNVSEDVGSNETKKNNCDWKSIIRENLPFIGLKVGTKDRIVGQCKKRVFERG